MNMSRPRKSMFYFFLTAFIFMSFSFCPGFSQETVLRGIVHDEQGNRLQKVKITLLDPSRGTRFVLSSNKAGEFIKVGIPPSAYKASFELEGYFPFETQLVVSIGMEEKVVITLKKIPPKIDDDEDFVAGINFFNAGNYQEAIDAFLKAAERFPENVEPFYNLGISYLRNGNPESAISPMEKVIKMKPDTVEAYFALGECYFNLGQSEKALEAFSKATNFDPHNAKAYYNLGILYYKYDKTDEALGYLEKAIELDPKLSSAYYEAGLANVKKGEYQKAIKYFEDFLKLSPDSSEANQAKAIIEELKKKLKES
ncbi:MAG: tetratricopeptide repeat protein [Clostridiales bacterium]|nr:tetratricopeptide repeat protein [Clostridiales bacterium]